MILLNRSLPLLVICALMFTALACSDDVDGSNGSTVEEPSNTDSTPDPDPNSEDPDDDERDDSGENSEDPDDKPDDPVPDPQRAPPVPGVDPAWIGGHSVEGRPIVVEHYGDRGPVLFVLSAIHGSERLAVTFGERFRAALNAGYAERHGIQVLFMGATNPDGIAVYDRYNANGLDLNRNFDTFNFEVGGPGGDFPLSEPEALAISDAIDASGLTAALSVHCCVPIFDHDGPGEALAQAMADAMAPDHRIEEGKLGASAGSLGSYVGLELGLPIITVEFARAEDMDPLIQLAEMEPAFDAAAVWTAENPGEGQIDFDAMVVEDEWSYRSWFAGESAGGLPLRAESIGSPGEETYVLLAGLDGERRLGVWIAEHVRRELLAMPDLAVDGHWRILTAANPDGLASGTGFNEDGVDVKAAITAGDASSGEAAAALELLGEAPATIFLVESGDDEIDRIAVVGARAEALTPHIHGRFQASPAPEDMTLAEALVERGHTVVQIVVATENAEAQAAFDELDPALNSPFDFSEMVLQMAP